MKRLREYARDWDITIDEEKYRLFQLYSETLVEWNRNINLTAITEPDEIAVKHFMDSIIPLTLIDFPHGERILDVGTGAGFPSVPLKIMRPDLHVVMLDSLRKRINFLMELSGLLMQENEFIHGRAEDFARTERRESFPLVVSRAVAPLNVLLELTIPFVKPDGMFLAWKAGDVENEVREAKVAIDVLGGQIMELKRYELPNGNKRSIIMIKKISQTPTKYPRKPSSISKKPL